ncbi:MAG: family 16 glycoside hydrolase [Nostocoides sp.]
MIEVNRRQLLLGGVASVAASGVVASDAVAARAGETFIDTFAANQGHWVDTVGAWGVRAGRLVSASSATDATLHSVRTRERYGRFTLAARVRHVGRGSTSFIAFGNPAHRSGTGEWGPSYRLGYTRTGMVYVVKIGADHHRTLLLGPVADAAVDPGGWNEVKIVAVVGYQSIQINGGTFHVTTDSQLSRGYIGMTGQGRRSLTMVDQVRVDHLG